MIRVTIERMDIKACKDGECISLIPGQMGFLVTGEIIAWLNKNCEKYTFISYICRDELWDYMTGKKPVR